MAAFDFSQSFSGINNALTNLGKTLREQADTDAMLKAFDAMQGGNGGGLTSLRSNVVSDAPAPALTGPGDYFSRTRSAESSNDDAAKNPRSTATGRYQFLTGTWNGLMKSNPELGLTMEGRNDPGQQEKAMRVFTAQNADALRAKGIDPTDRNLYMTHFLGSGASPNFISAVQQDPSVPAASLVDARVAAANRPVFYNSDGTPRTAGEVYARMTNRFGDGSTAVAALGGGRQPVQVAQASAPGDDAAKLRADAAYYEKTNPEAARQMLARADALGQSQAQGGQTAEPDAANMPSATAAQAQGFAIPGGQPATRENVSGGMIRALLANPGTRDMGKALWQQALTGKQYGFITGPDGAIYRTSPNGGTIEKVLDASNPKTQLEMQNIQADIALKQKQLNDKKLTTFSTPDGRQWSFNPETNQATPIADGAKPLPQQSIKGDDGSLYSYNQDTGTYTKQVASGPKSEDVTSLRKEIQGLPSYKNLAQAAPIYRGMVDAAGRETKAADLNLVYGLGKIMDPTSVVREGEMVMVKNSASLPEWLKGQIDALNGGAQLTPETRQAIMREAYGRVSAYGDQFGQDTAQYEGILQRRGMNRDDVLPSFGQFSPWEAPKKGAKDATAPAPAVKPGSVAVPPPAVRALRADPSLADQFDAKYGAGAAKRILSGK